MTLLAVVFALNAQAGSIAWEFREDFFENWNAPTFNTYSQLHLFVIVDDNRQGILDALTHGTFNVSMPEILDYRVVMPASVSPEIYHTPDNPDIVAGKEYSVTMLIMYQFTQEIKELTLCNFVWVYYRPITAYADDTSPVSLPPVGYPLIASGSYYHPIPEPATGLLALGGIALLFRRKRN